MMSSKVENQEVSTANLYEEIFNLDTDYHFQGKVFVTTNEIGIRKTEQILKNMPNACEDRYYFGFSGWHNFDIICLRRNNFAVLGDKSQAVHKFWLKTFEIITKAETPQEFVNLICSEIETNHEVYSVNFTFVAKANQILKNRFKIQDLTEAKRKIAEVHSELFREGSWLFSKDNYDFIRTLVLQKKIVSLRLDVTDTEKFEKINAIFKRAKFALDTLYISNVYDHVMAEHKDNGSLFKASLAQLITPESIIIVAPFNNNLKLVQQFIMGSAYDPEQLRKDPKMLQCNLNVDEDAYAYRKIVYSEEEKVIEKYVEDEKKMEDCITSSIAKLYLQDSYPVSYLSDYSETKKRKFSDFKLEEQESGRVLEDSENKKFKYE